MSVYPVLHLLHFQRMCLESQIKDEGIRDHQGAREGFLFVSLSRTAPPPPIKVCDVLVFCHTSIGSHIALFRLLWFRLFCFALLCCVVFCFGRIKPPWGGFITPKGVVLTREVVLSPIRGGYITPKGWFYPPKGVVLSPIKLGIQPPGLVLRVFLCGFMPGTNRCTATRTLSSCCLSCHPLPTRLTLEHVDLPPDSQTELFQGSTPQGRGKQNKPSHQMVPEKTLRVKDQSF